MFSRDATDKGFESFDQTASQAFSQEVHKVGETTKVGDVNVAGKTGSASKSAEALGHVNEMLGTVVGQQTVPEAQQSVAKAGLDGHLFSEKQLAESQTARDLHIVAMKVYELGNGDPVVGLAKLRAMAKQG